jgi:hypothetical protein
MKVRIWPDGRRNGKPWAGDFWDLDLGDLSRLDGACESQ